MDKDRIKGKIEDIGGRVQRQVGEWTGDKKQQAEGLKHQVKGKMRNIVGQMKDKEREATKEIDRDQPIQEEDLDIDRDEGAA